MKYCRYIREAILFIQLFAILEAGYIINSENKIIIMILAKSEILKYIKSGKIEIEPFSKKFVGPGSVDLHLGNEFRVFKKRKKPYNVTEKCDFKDVTKKVKIKDSIVVKPGELIHGITKERIKLPEDICGRLEGRSRFARLGLLVHITAGFIHPGINNRQVLEITNMAPFPLRLYPGTKVCQIIFEKTIGKGKYTGRFKAQRAP